MRSTDQPRNGHPSPNRGTHPSIPDIDYATRLAECGKKLLTTGINALLVSNRSNMRYLTGFAGAGTVLVFTNEYMIITDSRYHEAALQCTTSIAWPGTVALGRADDHARLLRAALRATPNMGIEASAMTMDVFTYLHTELAPARLVPTLRIVEDQRLIKDEGEIARIRTATAIADSSFASLLDEVTPEWTERQIANSLVRMARERGGDNEAFDTIVASGANSARPHAVPHDQVVGIGNLIVIDFGVLFDGYRSDMTRTIWFGKLESRLAEMYNAVLEANRAGRSRVLPGSTYSSVDKACRDSLHDQGGLDVYFTHPTGHNLGLDIHETPYFTHDCDTILRLNQAVTVEPGVYVSPIGGVRIEDTLIVSANSATVLTTSEYLSADAGM